MEKKTPTLFFCYSACMVALGIMALRYYYERGSAMIAGLGLSLLIFGAIGVASAGVYTLHGKGEMRLKRLLIVSLSGLFSGLCFLRLNYYINSHSTSTDWNQTLEMLGAGLSITGLFLLVAFAMLCIAKILLRRKHPKHEKK